MPKKDTPKTLSKLPKPSRFLLADENWEDYEYRLQCLVEDEKPANMLEYRQLELIARCDIDIDRQYRIVSQHLNPLGEAPSNLASIGRYVLTPDIFETLRGLGAGSGGEVQLADAINIHAGRGAVETVRLRGLRFDCGSVDGFMRASQHEYQRRQAH